MYTIKPITDKKVWDDFVDAAEPSSFLHAYAWGEVETDMKKKIFRLGVFTGPTDELVAVCLLSLVRARRGDFLLCPHGPIFKKGIVADNEVGRAKIAAILEALTSEWKKIAASESCVFIRICPLLIDTPEHNQIFKKLGFKPAPIHVYTELSWILDIRPNDEELLANMKKQTRYGIRKAERDGIVVRSSDDPKDIDIFWNVYAETAKRQQFVPYSKEYIAAEFARYQKDGRARWYTAYYKDEPVSTAMIVFNNHSAFYHHGASIHKHSAITPSELLQWTVIQDAKARGCTQYNFWGVVPDEAVSHPWIGLSNFKKGFGGYAEAYVHAQDYPLSWKYGITYVIETIRRLRRGV